MLEKHTFSKLDQTDLNVHNCGIEDCLPAHQWGPGIRDHYVIHLVTKGKGSLKIKDQHYSLDKGNLFLVPANTLAQYKADDTEPWSYAWVGFRGLSAQKLCNEAGLSTKNPVIIFDQQENLYKIIEKMLRYSGGARYHELQRLSLLYAFFSLVIEKTSIAGINPETRQIEYLRQAIRFIEANYAANINISGIASHVGLDRSYMYSLFQKHMQITPKKYLTRFRMNKAIELLKTTLTVGEIAHSVGYDDALLFSKAFKKEKGITPSKYRRNMAKNL